MIKFVKCTYAEYQKIWLKERINNFLVVHYNKDLTIDQLTNQFLNYQENKNQDYTEVKNIIKEILEIL